MVLILAIHWFSNFNFLLPPLGIQSRTHQKRQPPTRYTNLQTSTVIYFGGQSVIYAIFYCRPVEQLNFEELITAKLKKIMMSVDLEQVTSKEVQLRSFNGIELTYVLFILDSK